MTHACKAVVIRCIDFRIKPTAVSDLLVKIGYPEGSYDTVSLAGAAKCLLSPKAGESEMLLSQIEISSRLHCISEVVVLYHDNCGAYGIDDPVLEETTQLSDLSVVKAKINERFPDLAVKLYIIKGVSVGNLRLESVTV